MNINFNNINSNCEFRSTWIDEKEKIVTFCELKNKVIPRGICKICEEKNRFYRGTKK